MDGRGEGGDSIMHVYFACRNLFNRSENDRWECTHLCMFQQVMLACRDWSVGWGGGYPLLRRSRDVICFWQSFYVNNLNSVLKLVLYFKILSIFSELNHMDITRYQAS